MKFLVVVTPPSIYHQAFKNTKNKHSKRQKTGSEDIEAGVAVVLVGLCSGDQKGKK